MNDTRKSTDYPTNRHNHIMGSLLSKDQGKEQPRSTTYSIQQPILDHNVWFLSEDEIKTSRGGSSRSTLETYTGKNEVMPFIATSDFFASVYHDIQATTRGDSIWIMGWSIDDVPFIPAMDSNTNLVHILSDAATRGVEIRIMIWGNIPERSQVLQIRDTLNKVHGIKFIFDDRVPHLSSSLHQKAVIIKRESKLVVYVGGIDLTSERWDTISHDQQPLRVSAGIARKHKGWIDGAVKIDGPAAFDVAATFEERWNNHHLPCKDLEDALLEFSNPPYDWVTPMKQQNVSTASTGSKCVQIMRTYSPKYSNSTFAPHGELSLLNARIRAIRNARNYIYIEDQYFVHTPDLYNALMEVLPRIQYLIVVTQLPSVSSPLSAYASSFSDMTVPLKKQFRSKVLLFMPKSKRDLYVHSKIVIVDDVYLSIGSANWNNRSMTSDSEIGANIVDTEYVTTADKVQVTKFVYDFRLAKFSEFLGISIEKLEQMTIKDSAKAFQKAARKSRTIIQEIKYKRIDLIGEGIINSIIDPDDR